MFQSALLSNDVKTVFTAAVDANGLNQTWGVGWEICQGKAGMMWATKEKNKVVLILFSF